MSNAETIKEDLKKVGIEPEELVVDSENKFVHIVINQHDAIDVGLSREYKGNLSATLSSFYGDLIVFLEDMIETNLLNAGLEFFWHPGTKGKRFIRKLTVGDRVFSGRLSNIFEDLNNHFKILTPAQNS